MTTGAAARHKAPAGLAAILTLALLLIGCAEEGAEVTTTPAAATTAATTTTQAPSTTAATTTSTEATTTTEAPGPAISQIELLSGMLQGLLNGDEVEGAIGVGFLDGGRSITPPGGSARYSDFLCPEGLAILGTIDPAYEPQVSVEFHPEGEARHSAWISESLLYESAAVNPGYYATLVSALDTCAGTEAWEAPAGEPGLVRIERLDLPAQGDESYGFRISLNEGTGEPTWLETKGMLVRIGPGVLEVTADMIHGAPVPVAIGDGGLMNIAEAALAKVEDGLADAQPFTIAAADPEELLRLDYLLQGLPTTEEAGNGWMDQGRALVPPSATGQGFGGGVLCPEGAALVAQIGSGLDQQVFTSYRRDASPRITLSLLWGHRDQLAREFAAGADAVEACFGREPWATGDLGTVRMEPLAVPSLGSRSVAYHLRPETEPTNDPWADFEVVSILVTDLDPSNDAAIVITLAVTTVHNDPLGQAAPVLPDEELVRLAQTAVGKFAYEG
jgi:hypothetical protein